MNHIHTRHDMTFQYIHTDLSKHGLPPKPVLSHAFPIYFPINNGAYWTVSRVTTTIKVDHPTSSRHRTEPRNNQRSKARTDESNHARNLASHSGSSSDRQWITGDTNSEGL